jgi:hypothetical protein
VEDPAATLAEEPTVDHVEGNGSSAPLFAAPALPRRVPQASLDPRMRDTLRPVVPTASSRPSTNRIGGRSPEELRARLSQFQAAQAQARHETDAHPVAGRGEET